MRVDEQLQWRRSARMRDFYVGEEFESEEDFEKDEDFMAAMCCLPICNIIICIF
jgi:hypothetical protein